ncbi:homoserine O-acetyltransferase MetX [Ferrithrix thermotolerans]|uniref:homoserine O-acetyltransferase MetX n=1 Tax=Ferrithrix thermotolerans TaxID=209649 RepID=UPI001C4A6D4E|nr:homoserine O-acetyltransferase [Ferrithrix thermotolerans]
MKQVSVLPKRIELFKETSPSTITTSGKIKVRVLESFETESGVNVGPIEVAYETWGTLNDSASNAVLVLHALTGDSHVIGEQDHNHPTPGWWNGLIGPGLAIDTRKYFVVCPNVLGGCQGTTGPTSISPDGQIYGSRFPQITVGDQVRVERALSDLLGIDRYVAVIGGSMGGMRALEWGVRFPESSGSIFLLAVGPSATAEQIALSSLQIQIIQSDPNFHHGNYHKFGTSPDNGLRLARALAHLSYRSPDEMERRFGANKTPLGDYEVFSYLLHHGDKLVSRFDANSYIRLSQAMSDFNVGKGRGGIEHALRGIDAPLTVIGISSDRLFPVSQQHQIAESVPNCAGLHIIESDIGHDGFLTEIQSIGKIIQEALNRYSQGKSHYFGYGESVAI